MSETPKSGREVVTLDDYERAVQRTAPQAQVHYQRLVNFWLGLAGESGEVLDWIKKVKFHGTAPVREQLVGELGDLLWYVTAFANELGFSLIDVFSFPATDSHRWEDVDARLTGGAIDKKRYQNDAYLFTALVGLQTEVAKLGRALKSSEPRAELLSVLHALVQHTAVIMGHFDITFTECVRANVDKLLRRYPDGFSHSASRARVDVQRQ